jgi:hypothetical protein
MGVSSEHPLYGEAKPDWEQLRDTYKGERRVKERGVVYLPATSGMIADGMEPNGKGWNAYSAYRKRATFPELVKAAVQAMIGVMHSKPPVIELPTALEYLREKSTRQKESLELLLRRINEEQLAVGRLGLLLDSNAVPDPKAPFFIATYRAEDIINWDDGGSERGDKSDKLRMVVLNESGLERKPGHFEWEEQERYRVLLLGELDETEDQIATGEHTYGFGVFEEQTEFNQDNIEQPNLRGATLDHIPWQFVNANDTSAAPDDPPMLGLSNLCLTIYRGEADYRQALFMQGQDTLVIIGGEAEKEYRTGANATLCPPIGGDAKYIGVDSQGLPELRESLQNDYERANAKAGELINETSRERESGDALSIRVAARTATLNRIALAGAFALQGILRSAAKWQGANPDEVIVTPNLDFVDNKMPGADLVQLVTAKQLGAPLSVESLHKNMQEGGLTELTFEEEMEKIEGEQETLSLLAPPPTTDPNGPESDAPPGQKKPAPGAGVQRKPAAVRPVAAGSGKGAR